VSSMDNGNSGLIVRFLIEGDELEAGGEVGAGMGGFVLPNYTEVTAKRRELADLGREIYERFSGNALAFVTDPKILVVGNVAKGFKHYGPAPEAERDGYILDRMRQIEEHEDTDYCLVDLLPMAELEPLGGVDKPRQFTAQEAQDAGRPHVWLTLHNGNGGRSHFGIVGGELIEVVDEEPDGTLNWGRGNICDPDHSEDSAWYPIMSLLKIWASSEHRTPIWGKRDRDRIEEGLKRHTETGLIAGYSDHTGGGFQVAVHYANEDVALWTPAEGDAMVAALDSAAHVTASAEPFRALARRMESLLAEAYQLCDEANDKGTANNELEVRSEAADTAFEAVRMATVLLSESK
jgi:hypothetical protein